MNSFSSSPVPAQTQSLHIAIQGVAGSFHELAARQYFGHEIELVCCDSFPELFQQLQQPTTDYAVTAIENSVAGTILPNYSLIRQSGYKIIGEVYLRISHMLMALPGTSLAEIREVHSHPMALQQCLRFLRGIPDLKLVECDDTAASAARIHQGQWKGIAAVASRLAAERYDLEIIQASIEDDPGNFTRFFILGPPETQEDLKQQSISLPSSNHPINKSSLCFSLSHNIGSLAQVLLVLSAHGMNLTKIQSSPMVGRAWEYFFHLDLEFDDYSQYQRAISAIHPLVSHAKVLGEYCKAEKTPMDQPSSDLPSSNSLTHPLI